MWCTPLSAQTAAVAFSTSEFHPEKPVNCVLCLPLCPVPCSSPRVRTHPCMEKGGVRGLPCSEKSRTTMDGNRRVWKNHQAVNGSCLWEGIFFFFFNLFILFIYGCVGSSFLCEGFLQLRQVGRSEERRVGKECRSRWSPDH